MPDRTSGVEYTSQPRPLNVSDSSDSELLLPPQGPLGNVMRQMSVGLKESNLRGSCALWTMSSPENLPSEHDGEDSIGLLLETRCKSRTPCRATETGSTETLQALWLTVLGLARHLPAATCRHDTTAVNARPEGRRAMHSQAKRNELRRRCRFTAVMKRYMVLPSKIKQRYLTKGRGLCQ